MGASTSNLRRKSRSLPAVDSVRGDSRNSPALPFMRSRLVSLAQSSSKRLSKITFKRKSGNREQTRAFRELISSWPLSHLEGLERELEASRVLSLLDGIAERARPSIPSIGFQLLTTLHTDVRLSYKGEECAALSFVVKARCENVPEAVEGKVVLDQVLAASTLAPFQLNQVRRLICEEACSLPASLQHQIRSLLGIKRSFYEDMVRAEERAHEKGDLAIILSSENPIESQPHPGERILYRVKFSVSRKGDEEVCVRVDSALVAVRSPVLGRLLARPIQAAESVESEQQQQQRKRDKIQLDESLLPRAFLPLIVHYMYTDKLDLSLIQSSGACISSLSQVRAIVAGRSPNLQLQRAAHLMQIALFLGLDGLAQQCESVLLSHVSLSSCVPLLSWSLDSGSLWLTRQFRAFCLAEFGRLLHSPHLFDLPSNVMIDLLANHFLQASEVELLEGVVRWGEHELLRRMEQREPNLVADTVHSVSRRGLTRAELGSNELRALLAPVASLVRVDYVLPPFHQSLTTAYQRGILQRGSLRDLVVCASTSEIDPDIHWFSPKEDAKGPRFFQPYYQVVREKLKEKRLESGCSADPSTSAKPPSSSTPKMSFEKSSARCANSSTAVNSAIPVAMAKPFPLLPHLKIRNRIPELMTDAEFLRVKKLIEEAIADESTKYDLAHKLTRMFHRRMAVHLIGTRVMREHDVVEESISIDVGDKEEEQEVESEELLPGSHAQAPPTLGSVKHWPDLLPSSTAHSSPVL